MPVCTVLRPCYGKAKKRPKNKDLRRYGRTTWKPNSVRHGQRSQRANRNGLVHAKLGRRFGNQYGACNSLRKAIEAKLKEWHGSVGLAERGKVQTIVRLEESCRALEKAMCDTPGMSAEEIRLNRESVTRWSQQRDNLLGSLLDNGNGTAHGSPWDVLLEPQDHPAAAAGNALAAAVATVVGTAAGATAAASVPVESQLDDSIEGPQ